MDISPPASPRAGRPYRNIERRAGESPPLSPGAHPMNLSSGGLPSHPATSIPIRGANASYAPPALPPPRVVPGLAGVGPRHPTWQDQRAPKGVGVSPGSVGSLFGNWPSQPSSRNSPKRPFHQSKLSEDNQLPPSPLSRLVNTNMLVEQEESLPSLSSLVPPARPLDRHNHQKSNDAYDQQQLSKLSKLGGGRPKTPTRAGSLGGIETSPISGRPLRVDTQTAPFSKLSLQDRSFSAHPDSPFKSSSPWTRGYQQSETISPSLMSSTASTRSLSMVDPRSPNGLSSYAPSTAPSSLSAEQAAFSRYGSIEKSNDRSLSALSSAFESEERSRQAGRNQSFGRGPSEWVKSARGGSFDHVHPMFPEEDHSHEAEMAHHHLPFEHDMHGPQGIKRKASPTAGDELASQAPRSRTPARGHKKTSPPHHPASMHSSVHSSYGSSHPSIASINSPPYASSLAPSSITSYGTPEHLQSPGVRTGSLNGSQGTNSRHHSQSSFVAPGGVDASAMASQQSSTASAHAGGSSQQGGSQSTTSGGLSEESSAPSKQAGGGRDGGITAAHIHVCDCCPKKPKKFDTLEALQTHQREKQFYCTYCHNRFKNKNEAERHQNSLHLRKQSWSCAALGNKIDRAFHPCNATPSALSNLPSSSLSSSASSTLTSPVGSISGASGPPARGPASAAAEFDVCGYCGKQFPNFPTPDWADRNKHLTEVHKFGECNQSKKFFRADHFRQHLKHSHQGQSGKWTNMLEQACLREEPPPGPGGVGIGIPPSAAELQQQQQQSSSLPMTPFQVEALQAANASAGSTAAPGMRVAGSYPSAIGAHVQYEPKIDEEDEARV